jgi:hypothetical protein
MGFAKVGRFRSRLLKAIASRYRASPNISRDQGRDKNMAEVSVLYDREGQTLTVWFSDRHQEHICEETGDEVVLMKDSAGRVIGFEKLNFSIPETDRLRIALETSPA